MNFWECLEANADYLDLRTGEIYQIQNYNQAKKFGLPTVGIRVVDSVTGKEVGYVAEEDIRKGMKANVY